MALIEQVPAIDWSPVTEAAAREEAARLPCTLRPELDRLRCEKTGCESRLPVLIEPPCHEVSVFLEYWGGGELVVVCGECTEPFMRLQVAG